MLVNENSSSLLVQSALTVNKHVFLNNALVNVEIKII